MDNDLFTKRVMRLLRLPNTHQAEASINGIFALLRQTLSEEAAQRVHADLRGDLALLWASSLPSTELPAPLVVTTPYHVEDLMPVVHRAVQALTSARLSYAVGGGIALEAYGLRKSTADIDLFLCKEGAAKALGVLREVGFHSQHTSERWIYKAFYGREVVDLIFASSMGVPIDEALLQRAHSVSLYGYSFLALTPEDLMLLKIPLILNPYRRDWEDIFALLQQHPRIDWEYLYERQVIPSSMFLSFLLILRERLPEIDVPSWLQKRLQEETQELKSERLFAEEES